MLAQTIQISFSSYAADTIRIHTGETGREIAFVPDMDISGEYSADFIVIKPDDTFVIAAATITNGKINVEIPEQAGAVAGAGHYILKIYDSGNVCIYSASGGFMVDDHLLTDSMIESVAEVYGYNFPEDFALKDEAATLNDNVTATNSTWSSSKISDEISAASDIIDDNEVLYNKTWSSEKISYELGNVHPFHVYTTTEQPVGRWIDGKMLYERTITIQNVYITSPDHQMYYGVIDLSSYISNISNIFPNIDKSYIVMPDTTVRRLVWIDYQSTNAVIPYAMSPRSDVTLVLTVQYTKSE